MQNLQLKQVPYNELRTKLAFSSCTGEYWPSVCTATTLGQHSPVLPSRSVSKRLLIQRLIFRGGPCNFPRSWLLPVLKDNVKDTELKYFFDVMLPLSANLRTKGNTAIKKQLGERVKKK